MNAEQQKKNKIMSILMKTEVSMVAIIAIILLLRVWELRIS